MSGPCCQNVSDLDYTRGKLDKELFSDVEELDLLGYFYLYSPFQTSIHNTRDFGGFILNRCWLWSANFSSFCIFLISPSGGQALSIHPSSLSHPFFFFSKWPFICWKKGDVVSGKKTPSLLPLTSMCNVFRAFLPRFRSLSLSLSVSLSLSPNIILRSGP